MESKSLDRRSIESRISGDELGLRLVKQVALLRSQSASRITWHSHDCIEVLLVLDGATAYEFADGRTVELPGGHFLAIAPGVQHRGLHDVRRPARLSGIMFDPSVMNATKNTPFTQSDLSWIADQFSSGANELRRMSSELRNMIKAIPPDFESSSLSIEPEMASFRLNVCGILLEAAKQLSSTRTPESRVTVQNAIDYMKTNLVLPCSIQHVAKAVSCSRARLFQVFKESTGMTPNDYWQRLRIDRAQELLLRSDQSITEISMECGFSSSQYFSSVFRKYSGATPNDYRLQERKKGQAE